jgi:hypothetical protein
VGVRYVAWDSAAMPKEITEIGLEFCCFIEKDNPSAPSVNLGCCKNFPNIFLQR